jgi:hypothetical protein
LFPEDEDIPEDEIPPYVDAPVDIEKEPEEPEILDTSEPKQKRNR